MAASVLNFNVGVLGHIDSGKTSLAKALSTIGSTASFDKNPQSQARGITIDLGFSSFSVEAPGHLKLKCNNLSTVQFTLVDCPGHASLIRTIIGGAQIIDMMMLVVDVTKGMQTQTAECLVIGEITCDRMLVVLNKIDLLPADKKELMIEKMSKKMQKTLEKTRFAKSPIIPVAAKPGGPEAGEMEPVGVNVLIDALCKHVYVPNRSLEGPFLFSVDHCFSIKGQGTVITGTVVQGNVAINDTIEIPSLKLMKKVKSMQMFKKPTEKASQGDRIGICVTQFDPKQMERGLVCSPGFLIQAYGAVANIKKIPYFKGSCTTKSKFHISINHETVMAKCSFFSLLSENEENSFIFGDECSFTKPFDFNKEYAYQENLMPCDTNGSMDEKVQSACVPHVQYVLLEFERPVILNQGCLLIGSRLDTDIHANVCRMAFHGKIVEIFTSKQYPDLNLPNLKVYKTKHKEGIVDRVVNEHEVIVRSLFKKETNIQSFIGLKVLLSTGENGVINGGFGQSGKVKIIIPGGLMESTLSLLGFGKKKEKASNSVGESRVNIILSFKRYIYDPKKKMVQSF